MAFRDPPMQREGVGSWHKAEPRKRVAAAQVLYDYLTEHAVTSGRFVPFKYMIARDFSGRHSAVPPAARRPPWPHSGTFVRGHGLLQVFHPAAPGSRFVGSFKESLALETNYGNNGHQKMNGSSAARAPLDDVLLPCVGILRYLCVCARAYVH